MVAPTVPPRPTDPSSPAGVQLDRWEAFWFLPRIYGPLRWVRVGLGIALTIWLVGYWSDIGVWFAADGLLASDRLGRLVASTGATDIAFWQWSPLYGLTAVWQLRLFLGVAIALAVLVTCGVGGRAVIALSWLAFLSLANRQWVAVGLTEVPLALGLIALLFAGSGPAPATERRWYFGFARRLLQLQVVLLLLAILAAQWFDGSWLDGEGFRRLLAGSADSWLDFSSGARWGWLCRGGGVLTLGLPVGLLTAAWTVPGAQRWAVAGLACWWLLLGLLSGHFSYGLAVAALVLSLHGSPCERGASL
jgi:hypothetical protein